MTRSSYCQDLHAKEKNQHFVEQTKTVVDSAYYIMGEDSTHAWSIISTCINIPVVNSLYLYSIIFIHKSNFFANSFRVSFLEI